MKISLVRLDIFVSFCGNAKKKAPGRGYGEKDKLNVRAFITSIYPRNINFNTLILMIICIDGTKLIIFEIGLIES